MPVGKKRTEELTLKEAADVLGAHTTGQGRGKLDVSKLRPHFVAVRDSKNPDLIVSLVMNEEGPGAG